MFTCRSAETRVPVCYALLQITCVPGSLRKCHMFHTSKMYSPAVKFTVETIRTPRASRKTHTISPSLPAMCLYHSISFYIYIHWNRHDNVTTFSILTDFLPVESGPDPPAIEAVVKEWSAEQISTLDNPVTTARVTCIHLHIGSLWISLAELCEYEAKTFCQNVESKSPAHVESKSVMHVSWERPTQLQRRWDVGTTLLPCV